MKNIHSIEFYTGSMEKLLAGFLKDFPYIALRVELDKYIERVTPWHWHQAVEIFYMESGSYLPNRLIFLGCCMIQDINTSIGEFDVSVDDYLFLKEFVANTVYDDYDRLVQLCDALAMPTGF